MARSGFVASLSSPVRFNNSFLVLSRGGWGTRLNCRRFLVLFVSATILCCLLTPFSLAQQSATGQSPFASVVGGGFETINVGDLNVHFAIPVVSKAGIGLNFDYVLNYDSSVWIPGGQWTPAANWGWKSVSEGSVGHIEYQFLGYNTLLCQFGYLYSAPSYYDPNGTWHTMHSASGVNVCWPNFPTQSYTATDGSGYSLTATVDAVGQDSMTISDFTDASGNAIVAPLYNLTDGHWINNNGGSITDPNHNVISTTGSTFTDTLGMTVLSVSGTNPVSYAYTGPNDVPGGESVNVNYSTYTVATNFHCSGIAEYPATQVQLVSSIGLPDGSSYTFQYEKNGSNYTGRISQVGLPTGGSITYLYTGTNNGILCADGTAIGLTRTTVDGQWQYARNSTGTVTTVTDPTTSNQTVYTFSSASTGYETERQVYQGSSTSGTLLLTKLTCYNDNLQNCATTGVTPPIYQTDVYTSLNGMSSSARVSTVFGTNNNVIKSAVYDFGATTPTRQTIAGPYGYTWNGSTTSPTCTTPIGSGVNNKPCQVQLENASGTTLRNAYFQYGTTTNPGSLLSKAVLTSGSTYLTTSATYNPNGTVATSFDANGNKTTYTQGACNNGFVTKIVPPISTLDTQFSWDTGCYGAKMMSATDPNNFSVSATYNDPFWRPTSKTDQLQNTVDFSYYPTVPINTTEAQMTFGSSDFDVFNTTDVLGRPLYAQQIEGPNGSWDTTQMGYSWNTTGRVATKTMPCVAAKGSGCSNGTTTVTHDALGRPLVKTDGGGGTITYTYSGSSSCTSPLLGCEITTVVLGPAPSGEVVKQVAQESNGLGQLIVSCAISSATGSTSCGFGGYNGFPTTYTYSVPSGRRQRESSQSIEREWIRGDLRFFRFELR